MSDTATVQWALTLATTVQEATLQKGTLPEGTLREGSIWQGTLWEGTLQEDTLREGVLPKVRADNGEVTHEFDPPNRLAKPL